jgi:hypothetical protein
VENLDRFINSGLKCQLFRSDWNEEVIVDFEMLNSFNVLILGGQQQQSVEALICIHKPFRDFTNIYIYILKWILERQDGMVWIGLVWLRIGTSGRPL